MSYFTSRAAASLLALLLALFGTLGIATASPEPTPRPTLAAQSACGVTSGFPKVPLSSLPSQATDTVRLIQRGGPYPYPQDGTTFQNREGILPTCPTGYYKEFTVKTPGSSTRGARRIITGRGGEYLYTPDHYASFKLVDIGR